MKAILNINLVFQATEFDLSRIKSAMDHLTQCFDPQWKEVEYKIVEAGIRLKELGNEKHDD